MEPTVTLTVSDGVAEIVINRPGVLNALDLDTARLWSSSVRDALDADQVSAILLAGSGKAFCAGGDVEAISRSGSDYVHELATVMADGIASIVSSRIPVVAAVTGVVAGGGLGLLLSSDYAVASSDARMGALYAGIGMTPDLSVSALLGRAVGERRALELLLSDRMLSATEAREWGLVAQVVEPQEVMERSRRIARLWVDRAPSAFGEAKRLLRSAPGRTLSEQLTDEAQTIAAAASTTEAMQLIDAFLKSRRSR
ncbi:enoyl-CoA hydratase/isomerase family protein [Microcella pacifica]|uniref:Enoyl-CoA hydratase/isomerase family protein n=1 Tax=Microcella pacifica TaxID=2591847 RepID=A0A9E5JME0_9MICO|nr:enoyl-CoA hydratase/isomerase family protein [Microcella pacifica]NHF62175.1 enoyl-CoA hydratase/isomerase family protein [Microcella pacifica]